MRDWKERLINDLEPVLELADPRPKISAYHDMPYAIFCYPPRDEFALRAELALLQTRLEQRGKRITVISLAQCLDDAIAAEMSVAELVEAEHEVGVEPTIETLHQILSKYQPLHTLVVDRLPATVDPLCDIVFIVRTGALFPIYRTSSLLEQLKGYVQAPSVLFYPGETDGAAGLKFMGVLDAEHNYRPKIF
jgi:hypothetical protein